MPAALGPCLLVASPALRCPFFHHTVVLLVDHRDSGSLGFVLNRPAAVALRELLEHVGAPVSGELPALSVRLGGPVAPETGWIVADPTTGALPGEGVLRVTDRLAVCANLDALRAITAGQGPARRMLMLGYSGWAPGQLDEEIRTGSWIPVDLDADFVFDAAPEGCWLAALGRLGIDPGRVSAASVAEA
ncbi:MAG: YqgE/AlgH family protein [Myxococcales bacterium]|nr:YqgE/AlgH family protein [Myxococcales bacterium]